MRVCLILFVSVLLALLSSSAGKESSGLFTIQENGFHYLTKFGCSVGDCPWKVRVKLVNPWLSAIPSAHTSPLSFLEYAPLLKNSSASSIYLRLVLDESWERAPISRQIACSTMSLARVTKTLALPLTGEWSEWYPGDVNQVVRPHVWYFVADDCGGVIAENISGILKVDKHKMGPLKIEWEFRMMQTNGSHFSYEYSGTFLVSLFHTACYCSVLVFMGVHQMREMKRNGRIHVMLQMLNVCVLTQLASSLLHLMHLFAYSFNGHGIPLLDGIAETLAVVSQIVMSSVLIFIALGYSLNTAMSVAETTAVPTVIVLTLFHVALVCLDRFNADPRFKFHAADGFLGLVLTLLRLLLWAGFVMQGVTTIGRTDSSKGVVGFLRKFLIAGSLYFLAYPLVFGITCLFAPYLQHKVLTNGIFLMQLGSMCWLCSLFVRKGEYFKVSDLSQSYLPGGYLSTRGVHRLD